MRGTANWPGHLGGYYHVSARPLGSPVAPRHDDERPQTWHTGLPPWGFWLTLTTLALTGFSGLVNLRFDVESLKAWREETSQNRFTDKDWEREKLGLEKEIEIERIFSRALCNELVRLARAVGQVPANDCDRP